MSLPVSLRPEAGRDLQNARDWYEAQRVGPGALFAARAAAVIDALGDLPELFAVVWRHISVCSVARHPYVIYYRILPDRVEVIAVLHGSRDPSVWQGRASP